MVRKRVVSFQRFFSHALMLLVEPRYYRIEVGNAVGSVRSPGTSGVFNDRDALLEMLEV